MSSEMKAITANEAMEKECPFRMGATSISFIKCRPDCMAWKWIIDKEKRKGYCSMPPTVKGM